MSDESACMVPTQGVGWGPMNELQRKREVRHEALCANAREVTLLHLRGESRYARVELAATKVYGRGVKELDTTIAGLLVDYLHSHGLVPEDGMEIRFPRPVNPLNTLVLRTTAAGFTIHERESQDARETLQEALGRVPHPTFKEGEIIRHAATRGVYRVLQVPAKGRLLEATLENYYVYACARTQAQFVRPQGEMEDGRFLVSTGDPEPGERVECALCGVLIHGRLFKPLVQGTELDPHCTSCARKVEDAFKDTSDEATQLITSLLTRRKRGLSGG